MSMTLLDLVENLSDCFLMQTLSYLKKISRKPVKVSMLALMVLMQTEMSSSKACSMPSRVSINVMAP